MAVLVLGLFSVAWSLTYTWNQTGSGTFYWTNSANWTPVGYPAAMDDVANLSIDIAGFQDIIVDAPVTMGIIQISDSIPSGHFQRIKMGVSGNLTLQSSTGKAAIIKNQSSVGVMDVFEIPITLLSDLVVSNFSSGRLFFLSNISESGSRALMVEGSSLGTNLFGGSNSFGKGVTIKPGAVVLATNFIPQGNDICALGNGVITNDGILLFAATNDNVNLQTYGGGFPIAGSGTNIVTVAALGGVGGTGVSFNGNHVGFTGNWFVNPTGASSVGRVRRNFMTNDHANAIWHLFSNATMQMGGAKALAQFVLYGGTPLLSGQMTPIADMVLEGGICIAGQVNPSFMNIYGTGNVEARGVIRETNGSWGLSVWTPGGKEFVFANTNRFEGPLLIQGSKVRAGCGSDTDGTGPFGSNVLVIFSNATGGSMDLGGYDVRIGCLSSKGGGIPFIQIGTNQLTVGADHVQSSVFSGYIEGSGGLAKVSTNGLFLTCPTNRFSGGTILSAGMLHVGSNAPLGSGPVTISNQAVRLILSDGTLLTNDFFIYGGNVPPGRGLLEMPQIGTATLSNGTVTISGTLASGGHFYSGGSNSSVLRLMGPLQSSVAVTHRSGRVELGGGGSYSTYTVMNSNTVLAAHQGISTQAVVVLAQAANTFGSNVSIFDLAGFNQTLAAITNYGAASNVGVLGNSSTTADSTLTLTGSSWYDGFLVDQIGTGSRKLGLTVNGGTVTLAQTNVYSGPTVVASGTLRAAKGGTGIYVDNGDFIWDPASDVWPGLSTNLRGPFGSNSALILSNEATASVDLAGYEVQVGSLTGGGNLGGNIALGAGRLFVGADGTSPAAYGGILSGIGGLVKVGNGNLVLTGTNTYTGPTAVMGGKLVVDGALASGGAVKIASGGWLGGMGSMGTLSLWAGGTLSPGPTNGAVPATLRVGSADFQSGSFHVVDLDGSSGTADQILSTGSVTLAGNLVLTNYQNPTNGAAFTVLSAPSITGVFAGTWDGQVTNVSGRLVQLLYSTTNLKIVDQGPTVTIQGTNLQAHALCRGILTVAGTATNGDPATAIPKIYLSTNQGPWDYMQTGYGWSTNLDTVLLPDGTNTVRFLAVSSNYSNVWSAVIRVDNTPPSTVTFSSTTNAFYESLPVTLSATDAVGVTAIYWTTDGSTPTNTSSSVVNGQNVTVNQTTTLQARALDLAGNWGPVSVSNFTKIQNETGTGAISSVTPNPWKPADGPLILSITRTTTDAVDLLIVDLNGRLVAELKSSSPSVAYKNDYIWDGRDRSGRLVTLGLYRVVPRVKGVVQENLMRKLYVK